MITRDHLKVFLASRDVNPGEVEKVTFEPSRVVATVMVFDPDGKKIRDAVSGLPVTYTRILPWPEE